MKKKKLNKKAIALISGGSDSLLAARIIMEEGIEVQGICFIMQFASRDINAFQKKVQEICRSCKIPVSFVDISGEFLKVVKSPKYGYGANFNPCIDCKILMLQMAKKMMQREGASFIITGEVLGERPMSQRKEALNMIKRDSALEGYLLRPLSAKLLEETVPEKEGIVDRKKLLDISGRSRARQMKLLKKYNMQKFFAPAGGCLLTDAGFSRRLRDLSSAKSMTLGSVNLLKRGRHFRLDKKTKAIVGRDEKENEELYKLKKERDVMLRLENAPGPGVLLKGSTTFSNIKKAASLAVSHSKMRNSEKATVEYWHHEASKKTIHAAPLEREEVECLRL